MDWNSLKQLILQVTGLERDALHVHVGVMGQLLFALLARRSLGHPAPWLLVLLAALGNEYLDLKAEQWPDRDQQYAAALKDLWNTMLLPTLLAVTAASVPGLLVSQPRPVPREGGDQARSPEPDGDPSP